MPRADWSHRSALELFLSLVLSASFVQAQNAPFAHTQSVAPVSSTNATLNGMATPRGSSTMAWFEWGIRGIFDQVTPAVDVGAGSLVVRVSTSVVSLLPNTDYQYRLVASNVNGVAYGQLLLLTTGRRVTSWAHTGGPFPSGPVSTSVGVVTKIAFGDLNGLATKPDGSLAWWGRYYSAVPSSPPPPGVSNVVGIAGGSDHSLALRSDGRVFAWGRSVFGDVTNVPSHLTNIIAIDSGSSHALALRSNGTVFAWGQIGFTPAFVPTGLTNIVAIACGDFHCLALRNNGTVVTWGDSIDGNFPVPPGLSNVIAIAGGNEHSMALKSDGTIVAWGKNDYNQTIPPADLSNVVSIAAGTYQSLALRNDGTIVAWGQSSQGQTNIPPGMTNVVSIATGDYTCVALGPNIAPQVSPLSVTGAVNRTSVFVLRCTEPNGDPVTYRIASLPARGSLCQFTTNGCGDSISAPDTPVSDPLGRVIFTPLPDESGFPYTSFGFLANDGEYDSAATTMTVNIIPRPSVDVIATTNAVLLSFTGVSNATYRVWASTNLVNWSSLGIAAQPQPGFFSFNDLTVTNWTRRFYRVTAP